jgi:outer membrane protein assembly factor BamB
MIRAITFIPTSSGSNGLTYIERVSRNRSLHVLLQDYTSGGTAGSPASRANFLQNAYREIISRYVSFGRIEHPLPLVRSLVKFFDALSKRADCRVDDFSGLGFYVLFQDGETFYLLTSREGRSRLRTAGHFESLGMRAMDGVTELAIESANAQKELFSRDLRDFLALYRIESTVLDPGKGALDFAIGGSGEEMDTLVEALDQPGVIEAGVPEKTIPLNLVSRKMLYIRFDGLQRMRALYEAEAVRFAATHRSRRYRGIVYTAGSVVVLAAFAAVWLSARLSGDSSGSGIRVVESTVVSAPGGDIDETAVQPDTVTVPETTGDASPDQREAKRPGFSLAWDKSYSQPVTSTPVSAEGKIIFGGRDGMLYALDADNGELLWRFRASDGIGASPVVIGNQVVAADYKGNVFSIDVDNGGQKWNRKLPGRIVSSPCYGDGEILVGCYNGNAYALSAETGRVLWKVVTGEKIRGSAAFSDGRYYLPSYDGNLYAVTAGIGSVRWKHSVGGPIAASPAANAEHVVIGAQEGFISCLDALNGTVVWKFKTDGAVKSFLTLSEGRVFAGSDDKSLYCLDEATGQLVWEFETGGIILGRPAIFDEYVVFPSYDGHLYYVEATTGEQIDRFETTGPVFSSPTVSNGNAYFGNNKGKLYCVNLSSKATL